MSNWYESSFGSDYLRLYSHRNLAEARANIGALLSWLPLPPDEPLLDLACGAGRVLLALHERGFSRLVGLDLSPDLLSACARSLREVGVEPLIVARPEPGAAPVPDSGHVVLVQGDMRRIPYDVCFASVLSVFTSFGYFDTDAQNAEVLAGAFRALRSGGRLILDYLSREHVVTHLVPEDSRQLPDGTIVRNHRRLSDDGLRVEKVTNVVEAGGAQRTYRESVRMYDQHELLSMLERCGYTNVDSRGDFSGAPYSPESERLLLIAQKGNAS